MTQHNAITNQDLKASNTSRFHRWYDVDFYVSEMVLSVEQMNDEMQWLFARLLYLLCQEVVEFKGKRSFVKDIAWEKLLKLARSNDNRRWYDADPELKRAFTLLYSLTTDDKVVVSRVLYKPSLLVKEYADWCDAQGIDVRIENAVSLVEKAFKDGDDAAVDLFDTLTLSGP